MPFNSVLFVAFFLGVSTIYFLPGLHWTPRKLLLVTASYAFYAVANPPFVLLLWLTTLLDWRLALAIQGASSPRVKSALLFTSLGVSLGLLAFFKYGPLFGGAGWVIPLGISFYTFETISYVVDVYRGRMSPVSSLLDYALFISFFPHLVAGPIVRAEDFLPQCDDRKSFCAERFSRGLVLMIIGLFEKVILADTLLAPLADRVFGAALPVAMLDGWFGTAAFSGQILFDFAGYSTCGIGAALCLGFVLPENFRFPYAAIGFSDFWKRWHISLSSWLRDYLYIPLGGNRRGSFRTQCNLMVTMLLGGLWHGSSWRFVAWGGIHGVFLLLERGVKACVGPSEVFERPLARFALGLLTFLLVSMSWVFFRARNFRSAWGLLGAMTGLYAASGSVLLKPEDIGVVALVLGGTVSLHAFFRKRTLYEVLEAVPPAAVASVLGILLIAMVFCSEEQRAFIYFRF